VNLSHPAGTVCRRRERSRVVSLLMGGRAPPSHSKCRHRHMGYQWPRTLPTRLNSACGPSYKIAEMGFSEIYPGDTSRTSSPESLQTVQPARLYVDPPPPSLWQPRQPVPFPCAAARSFLTLALIYPPISDFYLSGNGFFIRCRTSFCLKSCKYHPKRKIFPVNIIYFA